MRGSPRPPAGRQDCWSVCSWGSSASPPRCPCGEARQTPCRNGGGDRQWRWRRGTAGSGSCAARPPAVGRRGSRSVFWRCPPSSRFALAIWTFEFFASAPRPRLSLRALRPHFWLYYACFLQSATIGNNRLNRVSVSYRIISRYLQQKSKCSRNY